MLLACLTLAHGLFCPTQPTVEKTIVHYAEAYDVSAITATRIASCESTFQYNAKNPNSSARGIYQWIDGTWGDVGGGDRQNYLLNIIRFMQYYPTYPQWWECK